MLKSLAVAVGLSVSLLNSAAAEAILTTYPTVREGIGFSFSSTQWEAVGFRTGATGFYDLQSVVMRLSSEQPGDVAVGIYASGRKTKQGGWSIDSGPIYYQYNTPDALVGSQTVQSVSDKADYSFAFSDVTLAPNTLYWIVFKALGDETFKYYWNDVSQIHYDPITSYSDWKSLYKSETGASIYDFASSPCQFAQCSGDILGYDWTYHSSLNIIGINGSPRDVPEPASAALAGIGIASLIVAQRGRRRTVA